ncbi:MAG: hypothetical protein CVU47_13100 [Chloroflexi bacterium HGW-Chloroflexi-9]|nr:MAG: hypothetical protein CVU47_13100 [Chloroflexi bacterium HGW-Chloroflexi-9]
MATPKVDAAVKEVLEALMIPGPDPVFHLQMKYRLAREWPALSRALAHLHDAALDGTTGIRIAGGE